MAGHPIRRTVALLVAAVLSATLAGSAFAADVEPAAKTRPVFKCAGVVATKVGTPGRDVIRGTARRDVIVGLGGNDRIEGRGGNDLICAGPGHDLVIGGAGLDRIYGQAGRDRLLGGPGPDWLAGQGGNDRFNGGIGVDTCHQGPGVGLKVSCERPLQPPVAAPVAPPSPPEPKTLAIAYTDLVRDHQFGTGDVLIAKLVDTNLDGAPSRGDTIELDRYPTDHAASLFGDWGLKLHIVTSVGPVATTMVNVRTASQNVHEWSHTPDREVYAEWIDGTSAASLLQDGRGGSFSDHLQVMVDSPSQPPSYHPPFPTNGIDDKFIDVEVYVTP